MSILLIWCSPNKNGLTAAAARELARGAAAAGRECETLHLNAAKLEMCRACGDGLGSCRPLGKCCLNDGFNEIYEKCARRGNNPRHARLLARHGAVPLPHGGGARLLRSRDRRAPLRHALQP